MSSRKKWTFGLLLILIAAAGGWLFWGQKQGTALTIGVYAGSYWETPDGNCYQILDETIEQFEQTHPGVQVEYASGIGTDSYSEWLAEQILQGTEPDLYFVLPEDFNLLVSSGALENLDGLMAEDRDFDPAVYYGPCLEAGQFGGSQYALPHESVPTMMFVNKTLLEGCGIPVPENDWTWEDFFSICQQVTDTGARRFGVYGYTWLNALYANGASLFSEDGTVCFLADPRIEAAIQFTRSLNELNGGYTVTARDFDLGHVAFRPFLFSEYRAYQPYPWRIKKYTGFEWDCVCMPAGPDGANVSELHTMLLGINARTPHKLLAWEFAKLLSTDEQVQKKLYAHSVGISPLPDVAEDNALLEQLYQDIPGSVRFSREMVGGIMQNAVAAPHFSRYEQAMAMAQQAVSEGQIDKSSLAAAQREINIYLSK